MEYQKFYVEWIESEQKETPVHWKPREGKWERLATGEVKPIQNTPIQVNYPEEMNEGIWGGEGVVQGLVKKGKWRSPVPRYWSPQLKKSIVYSEILDKYFSVVVTERALRLIDQHHGLDAYLLTTPAYDLKSLLTLKLKRIIMMALMDRNCFKDNPQRQDELLEKYKEYLLPRNELEWYGLSIDEALEKVRQIETAKNVVVPLKMQYRADLIEQLKQARITGGDGSQDKIEDSSSSSSSWMSKLNPFSKGQDAR
jgi:large subunit ribosomal protein L28